MAADVMTLALKWVVSPIRCGESIDVSEAKSFKKVYEKNHFFELLYCDLQIYERLVFFQIYDTSSMKEWNMLYKYSKDFKWFGFSFTTFSKSILAWDIWPFWYCFSALSNSGCATTKNGIKSNSSIKYFILKNWTSKIVN